MIKSTKISLKFSNKEKLFSLSLFCKEYKNVVIQFINLLWNEPKIPALIPKTTTSKVSTWLSARAVQCAAKQASGIVRGTQLKQKRRLYQINKFKEQGNTKKARKLQHIYDNITISKPWLDSIDCELDERFVKIDLENKTSFDGWITLTSLGNKLKIKVPFKKHEHFNKMLKTGTLKKGIRLSNKSVTFNFECKDIPAKTLGKTIGIDIGQKTTLSCSNNQLLDKCKHGHTYSSICTKLARKKKGSKNFNQAVKHRSKYLHYIVNNLNLDGVKVVNRENIKHLRKFSNTSRKLKHWNYAELFEVLDNKLVENGVHINKLNPTYTSQRCSSCGWVRKNNRKGKQFKCTKCSFEHDADLNASINLSFNLIPLGKQERLQQKNRAGFYWNVVSEAPIVPHAKKTNCNKNT